jgi:hypothetical protein
MVPPLHAQEPLLYPSSDIVSVTTHNTFACILKNDNDRVLFLNPLLVHFHDTGTRFLRQPSTATWGHTE